METKIVNRKIPEDRENTNDRFRVRYKDKNSFDNLEVNIIRLKTGEKQTFKFASKELPNKDSIHFTTQIDKGKLIVKWTNLE